MSQNETVNRTVFNFTASAVYVCVCLFFQKLFLLRWGTNAVNYRYAGNERTQTQNEIILIGIAC